MLIMLMMLMMFRSQSPFAGSDWREPGNWANLGVVAYLLQFAFDIFQDILRYVKYLWVFGCFDYVGHSFKQRTLYNVTFMELFNLTYVIHHFNTTCIYIYVPYIYIYTIYI